MRRGEEREEEAPFGLSLTLKLSYFRWWRLMPAFLNAEKRMTGNSEVQEIGGN